MAKSPQSPDAPESLLKVYIIDFSPLLPGTREHRNEQALMLRNLTTVLAFGNRALLSALAGSYLHPNRLWGVVTTQSEALKHVRRHDPDLLICSDLLGSGDGVDQGVKDPPPAHPANPLNVMQRPTYRILLAAVKAGTGGICTGRMTGGGSLHGALHALLHDGSYLDRDAAALEHRCSLEATSRCVSH